MNSCARGACGTKGKKNGRWGAKRRRTESQQIGLGEGRQTERYVGRKNGPGRDQRLTESSEALKVRESGMGAAKKK